MDCTRARTLLSPYLDRQLGPEQRVTLEEHLASCAECRAILAHYQEIDRRLARLRGRGPSAPPLSDLMQVIRYGRRRVPRPQGKGRLRFLGGVVILALLAFLAAFYSLAAVRDGGEATPLAGTLYVALQNAEGQLAVVDVQTAKLVTTISVGFRPSRLAASRLGNRVYVIGEGAVMAVIDAAANAVASRYELYARPGGIAVSPDGKTLYISLLERRTMIYVDTADGTQVGQVRVGGLPREVVVTPDGQWAFVFNSTDNSVSRIRTSTKQETRVYHLLRAGDRAAEFSLHPMAVSSDGHMLYVAELNRERIWTIDLTNDSVKAADVPLRDLGRDMVVTPSGDRLYVTHGDPRGQRAAMAGLASMALPKVERTAEIRGFYSGVTLSPDGTMLFATNPDENLLIFADAQTLQTTATVAVGLRPASIVYVPRP